MKLKIISCNVMRREMRYCAARSPHRIDIEFVDQGLHESPEKLNRTLADRLASVEPESCDYVLLNYGVCGNGTLSLTPSRDIPMIIQTCHDCIRTLVGDRNLHEDLVEENRGTFWFSNGWIDGFPLPGAPDYNEKYRSFYGQDIDEDKRIKLDCILMENYSRFVYICWPELGEAVNGPCREYTKRCVRNISAEMGREFTYKEVRGRPDILQRFVDGEWNPEEFLRIEPGFQIQLNAMAGSICALSNPL